VKDAYKEVLVSPYTDGDKVKIKVVSDRQTEMKVVLDVSTMSMDGAVLFKESLPLTIGPNASSDVFEASENSIFAGQAAENSYVVATLTENGEEVAANVFFTRYANKYKYAEAKPDFTIQPVDKGFTVQILSKNLIRGLYLHTDEEDDFFGKNYLNLLPGIPVDVTVESKSNLADFKKQLKFNSYNSIWLAQNRASASE
jgi:hypothetical protein